VALAVTGVGRDDRRYRVDIGCVQSVTAGTSWCRGGNGKAPGTAIAIRVMGVDCRWHDDVPTNELRRRHDVVGYVKSLTVGAKQYRDRRAKTLVLVAIRSKGVRHRHPAWRRTVVKVVTAMFAPGAR